MSFFFNFYCYSITVVAPDVFNRPLPTEADPEIAITIPYLVYENSQSPIKVPLKPLLAAQSPSF